MQYRDFIREVRISKGAHRAGVDEQSFKWYHDAYLWRLVTQHLIFGRPKYRVNRRQMLNVAHGCYFAESASLFLSHQRDFLVEMWNRYLEAIAVEGTSYQAYRPRPIEITDLDSFWCVLDRYHELCHYQSLVSSPFGLFLFRLLNASTSCVQYVCLKIADEVGGTYTPERPLTDWFQKSGKLLVNQSSVCRPDIPLRGHLEAKLLEAHLYDVLLAQLLYPGQRTVGQICELLNHTLRLLQILHSLPTIPKVTSRHDPNRVVPHALSIVSLLEGIAMLAELQLLISFKASADLLHKWESQRLKDNYRDVVAFVSGKLSHSVKRASLALDVSLLGQIDPVFQDADEVFLEDIHPLMRLEQILPEFAGLSDESFQGERLQETMSNMSKKFSWSSCMDLAATARQGAFVYSETWDAMKRTFDVDADEAVLAQPLYTDALSQCLRGLELRAEDPGVFAFHHTALVYQPLLEFYTDYVHIHGGLERGDIQYLLFRHLVLGLTCRGLLGLDSESIPLARLVADSFASTIKSAGGERGTEWPHWVPLSYNESIHKDLGINGDKLKG